MKPNRSGTQGNPDSRYRRATSEFEALCTDLRASGIRTYLDMPAEPNPLQQEAAAWLAEQFGIEIRYVD